MILNGRLPAAMLTTIPGTNRRVAIELMPQVAALRDAFAVRFGKPLVVTDAYRTFEEQVRLKAEKGVYAATPGTSNHGWGRAFDFGSGVNAEGSPEYRWMKQNAPRFGVTHPLWAEDRNPANGQQEPWHWEAVYVPPSSYTTSTTAGTTPTTTSEAPDMDAAQDARLKNVELVVQNIENLLARGSTSGGGVRGDVLATLSEVNKARADIGTVANEVRALSAKVGTGGVDPAAVAAALADPLAHALAPLLSMLPDADIERIRDAAVEALELVKGTTTYTRKTQQ